MADIAIDRSTRPWLILALLSLAHAVIHAQSALLPLIYPFVIAEFHLTAGDIGLFIAVTTAVGGLMQFAYGFAGRYVARPVLLGVGQVVFGLGLVAGAFAQSLGHLMGAVSAARIGSSPQHPVGNALLSDRFPAARRGIAISAHISGGNIGTLVVPFIGFWVIGAVGWQGALAAFGIPALVVGVLILLFVHEDHSAYRAAAMEAGPVMAQLGAVLRRADIRWILLASLAAAGGRGLNIAAPFMLLYLQGPLGFDEGTISLLYGLLLVGSVIGPLLAGWISDRFGRRRTLIAYYFLSAVGIVLFVAAGSSLVLLVPLLLPFGTAVFSESPVLQAYLADRSAGPMRDVAFAVYFTVAFGVGALWGLIIGWIVEGPGYQPAFFVMAASFVVAGVLIASVREGARPAAHQSGWFRGE